MTKKTRRAKTRKALLALSLVLVTMMVTVGGTIAWLTAQSTEVKNTFAPSTINIELKEHEYVGTPTLGTTEVTEEDGYKMVPGATLPKDPFVRVKANSEACYVFVQVDEANISNFISYTVNTAAWTKVDNTTNVYYYGTNGTLTTVPASSTDTVLTSILTNNQVTVKDTVTKAMMDGLTAETYPTLTFKAYAIQAANLSNTDIAGNWTKAQAQ